MTLEEHLFYGFGQIVYAIAKADGHVQSVEDIRFRNLVEREFSSLEPNLDVSQIIFFLKKQENLDPESAYQLGIKDMEIGKKYLTPERVERFLYIVQEIAKAFPPITQQEQDLITRFQTDLQKLRN